MILKIIKNYDAVKNKNLKSKFGLIEKTKVH